MNRKRVAVLFSGRGSNMESLIRAAARKGYPARLTHAFTNMRDAGGLAIAGAAGLETAVISHRDYPSREAHEADLIKALEAAQPEIICLAGYMRILTGDFTRRFAGRILNIHPSLLPSFKGIDTHARALEAGVRLHGASVHFVDETLDGGQIIAQAAVPVHSGDNEERLAARVLAAEHQLYPHALALVASGRVRYQVLPRDEKAGKARPVPAFVSPVPAASTGDDA